MKKSYPVKEVLKTTSPTWVPLAPNDLALQTEPSSSTNLASEVFQGLSTTPKKTKKAPNFSHFHARILHITLS